MSDFNIGDRVMWSSGGGHGKFTIKIGTIVAIVKHNEYAFDVLTKNGFDLDLYSIMFECALPIVDDIRYVVEVPHQGKGQPRLYFPRKGKLRLSA